MFRDTIVLCHAGEIKERDAAGALDGERDQLCAPYIGLYVQPGHGDGQLKAPWAGTPRVEKQDAVTLFELRTMGMPRNHRSAPGQLRAPAKRFDIM
jgi:hypothetical protein